MNDDLTLLASAYLDGDVTADERARIEVDPEAVAEVERLRAVRALLGDVEPSSISLREAHLAAALDAWDRLPQAERTGTRRDVTPAGIDAAAIAGAASVTAPTRLRDRRRGSSTRWLPGVAAGLVLVLAGGVALQLRSEGDDDVTSSADAEAVTADSSRTAADDTATAELATAGDVAEGEETSNDGVTDGSEVDTGIASAAPPGEDAGLDQLRTPEDLADFAATAVGAPIAPDDVPAATSATIADDLAEADVATEAFPVCFGVDLIVGPAMYLDVAVVVGIDEGRDLAIAYVAEPCAEVARAPLP